MLEKKCGSIIQQVKADQSIRIKLHAVQGAAQQKVVGEMHLERAEVTDRFCGNTPEPQERCQRPTPCAAARGAD